MKILIACDKFRGSLEGPEVSENLKIGLLSASPGIEITIKEIADGGEGSMQLLSKLYDCSPQTIEVEDALQRRIHSSFGFNKSNGTAILEMASYTGLADLEEGERNPFTTSSFGLGLAIREALKQEAKHLIIGVGGSASNDGGAGMLHALGFSFLDEKKNEVHPKGGNLDTIRKIASPATPLPTGTRITIATDVNNPVSGPDGATYTYARQKGAKESDLPKLEENLTHFANLIQEATGNDVFQIEGYGAAGGVPLAACELLGAEIISGSELIFQRQGMKSLIRQSDLIITGEGKIDHQTLNGKAISPIVEAAVNQGKSIVLVCGLYDQTSPELDEHSRYELAVLANELNLDSFTDAAELCQEIGRRIAQAFPA